MCAHLVPVAATIEEQGGPQLLPLLYPRMTLLQEASEGRQAGAGAHHDDGGEGVTWQLETGGAHEDGSPAGMAGPGQDVGQGGDGTLHRKGKAGITSADQIPAPLAAQPRRMHPMLSEGGAREGSQGQTGKARQQKLLGGPDMSKTLRDRRTDLKGTNCISDSQDDGNTDDLNQRDGPALGQRTVKRSAARGKMKT